MGYVEDDSESDLVLSDGSRGVNGRSSALLAASVAKFLRFK